MDVIQCMTDRVSESRAITGAVSTPRFPSGRTSESSVGADRPESADRARTPVVLGPEAEVTRGDARGGRLDPSFDAGVIGRYIDDLAAAQVEQQQPRARAAGHEPAPGRQPVEPQLHRVGLDERGIQ